MVERLLGFFGDPEDASGTAAEPDPALTPAGAALVAEAASRSGVVWLCPAGSTRRRIAWQVWHEGAVHVVTGGAEQDVPLPQGPVEVVVPSKDDRSALVTFLGLATPLSPGTPAWTAAAAALAAARLNAEGPEAMARRWATESTVTRIEPRRVLAAGTGDRHSPSGARPVPAEGSTTGRRPWHLGGRTGRAARR